MLVKVLRSFPYSRDGYTTLQAVKGERTDVPDHLVPGLEREGYIGGTKDAGPSPEDKMIRATPENKRTAEPRADQAQVEIPDDWRDLPWAQLRSLASKVSNDPVRDKDGAVAAVEAELARRD